MKPPPFRFLFLACLAGALAAPTGYLAVKHLDQRSFARPGFPATAFEWRGATPDST